ncbi:MAG: class I SAM-dependent methyltransferase [Thermoleophilia bacterium]
MAPEDEGTSGYYRDEFGRLARFYDLGLRLVFPLAGGEKAFREQIIAAAEVAYGQRVLDVNCGTGTLAMLMFPRAGLGNVTGIDLSPQMISMARKKAGGGEAQFFEANAEKLPFADRSFDRVTMSLAFHEMNREGRRNALAEIRRVLVPGGRLVIADLRHPDSLFTRFAMRILRLWETDTLTDMWRLGIGRELEQSGFNVMTRQVTGRGFFEIVAARVP